MPKDLIRRCLCLSLLLATVVGWSGLAVAGDTPLIVVAVDDPVTRVDGAEFYIAQGPVSPETLIDENWRVVDEDDVGLDEIHTEIEFWLRFQVQAQGGDADYWLVTEWANLTGVRLSVHDPLNDSWWHGERVGLATPPEQRYVDHRYPIFPLALKADRPLTIYMGIRANSFTSFPLRLWQPQAFMAADEPELIVLGLYFGSLAIMLLYNLTLFFVVRDQTYLVYSFHLGTVIATSLAGTGAGYLYLWGDRAWFAQHSFFAFSALALFTSTLFFRRFLDLKSRGGWLLGLNTALLALWAWMALISAFYFSVWQAFLLFVGTLLTCAAGILTGVLVWRAGNPMGKIYTLAATVLAVGTMVLTVAFSGLLPLNLVTRHAQMFGFLVEMALLSFALAYRITLERKQREVAQKELISLTRRVSDERSERLRAQEETLVVQRQLKDQLENRVLERTEQLKQALLRLEAANTELTHLSVTDALTQVSNRRHFDKVLVDECKRAYRGQHSLALILVDIDHFKSINDVYGHGVGDRCISLVAKTMQGVIKRPGDVIARYGGEEFAYILPATDQRQALEVANHCRLAVNGLSFEQEGERVALTVSAGVAAWIPASETDYLDMVAAADAALYEAKKAGRNCVMSAKTQANAARS